jgi:glycosyltransferase involved in cell wall biosynthesis
MEKILFVTNSFGMGGAEKVLLDIVCSLNKKFDVHVLVFHNRGPLKKEMEKHCQVFTLFTSPLHYLLFRKIDSYRRFRVNSFVAENNYKTVVGFMEGKSTDLVAEIGVKIQKIAWVHNDFRKLDIFTDNAEAFSVYNKMDSIVFVSGDAKKAFLEKFADIHSHLNVIYNVIDENNIIRLSGEHGVEKNTKFTFLNVGMLREQKCQDRLVRVARRLKDLGYDFQIQIIGNGPLHGYLSELIVTSDVLDHVFLLGMKENPYPYMKTCNCFVLCSDYEGYGIAVKEALFLKKLVLTTDVVGPREILENGKYGLIVENNEDSLFQMMQHILDLHRENREIDVMQNVIHYQGDNEHIREQLTSLFTE